MDDLAQVATNISTIFIAQLSSLAFLDSAGANAPGHYLHPKVF
jgi:hypothetical protein